MLRGGLGGRVPCPGGLAGVWGERAGRLPGGDEELHREAWGEEQVKPDLGRDKPLAGNMCKSRFSGS